METKLTNFRLTAADRRAMSKLQRLLTARLGGMGKVTKVSALRHAVIAALASEERRQKGKS